MAEWMVMLKGDPYDLADLAERFHTSKNEIVLDGKDYCLKSSDFSSMTSDSDVYKRAVVIIKRLNGIARVSLGASTRSIETSNVVRIDDDGSRHHFVSGTLNAAPGRFRVTATGIVTGPHGESATTNVPQQLSFEDCLAERARRDEFVDLVLSIYGNGLDDWNNLFRLYDGIEDAVGGSGVIVRNGWVTSKDEIGRFTGSAHNKRVAGEEVRHIGPKKSSNRPAKNTMTLSEAQAFIDFLVTKWLHSLCP